MCRSREEEEQTEERNGRRIQPLQSRLVRREVAFTRDGFLEDVENGSRFRGEEVEGSMETRDGGGGQAGSDGCDGGEVIEFEAALMVGGRGEGLEVRCDISG